MIKLTKKFQIERTCFMIFKPNMYQKNIYSIDYQKIKKSGVECLLFDLDNTCIGYSKHKPTTKLVKHFEYLKSLGFIVIIFSNARKKRLKSFKKYVDEAHHMSVKPFQFSFRYIKKKYHLKSEEIIIIGDQLYTDILGGNIAKINTCLVEPLEKEDFIVTKIFRMMERIIYKRLNKKYGFEKGKYYD